LFNVFFILHGKNCRIKVESLILHELLYANVEILFFGIVSCNYCSADGSVLDY